MGSLLAFHAQPAGFAARSLRQARVTFTPPFPTCSVRCLIQMLCPGPIVPKVRRGQLPVSRSRSLRTMDRAKKNGSRWLRFKDRQGFPLGTRKSWKIFQPCTVMHSAWRAAFMRQKVWCMILSSKPIPASTSSNRTATMRTWLFTILRNTFYSGLRKQKREVADPDGHFAATLATHPEHDGRLAMSEFLGAFAQLSSEHQNIVTLVGVSGHSCNVASRLIRVPVGTAKSRLSLARAQLTETLDAIARPGTLGSCATLPANRPAPQDGNVPFH